MSNRAPFLTDTGSHTDSKFESSMSDSPTSDDELGSPESPQSGISEPDSPGDTSPLDKKPKTDSKKADSREESSNLDKKLKTDSKKADSPEHSSDKMLKFKSGVRGAISLEGSSRFDKRQKTDSKAENSSKEKAENSSEDCSPFDNKENDSYSSSDDDVASDVSSASSSNPADIRVVSIHLDWYVNMREPTLWGYAILEVEQLNPEVTKLTVDIESLEVFTVRNCITMSALGFKTNESTMTIDLDGQFDKTNRCCVKIDYEKTDKIGVERDENLLYSQFGYGKAKHLFPCHDSLETKVLFSAVVHVNNAMQILMSGKLVKTEPESVSAKKMTFINPHPIPPCAIGFAIGKFQEFAVNERVKLYTEEESIPEEEMQILKQIPDYIQLFEKFVGEDVWGTHNIALVSNDGNTSVYPYLYILPSTQLKQTDYAYKQMILFCLSHNWFRNVATGDAMLNQSFSTYMARRLLALVGENTEKEFYRGAKFVKWTEKRNKAILPLEANEKDETSTPESEKLYIWLLVLEHFGGQFGEFDKLIKRFFEENKFQTPTMEAFAVCAKECLVFRTRCGERLATDVEDVTNITEWIDDDAPIPREFFKCIVEYSQSDVMNYIHSVNGVEGGASQDCAGDDTLFYFSNEESEDEPEYYCQSSYSTIPVPLLYLTPKYVKHRERKLVLVRHLQNLEEDDTAQPATEGKISKTRLARRKIQEKPRKPKRLKTAVLDELCKLGLNCPLDEEMKFEFVKLSIAHQWCAQLKQIKKFVAKCEDKQKLIDIMQGMIDWQDESDANSNLMDYKYTPMRQEIIELCDKRLGKIIAKDNKRLEELTPNSVHKTRPEYSEILCL